MIEKSVSEYVLWALVKVETVSHLFVNKRESANARARVSFYDWWKFVRVYVSTMMQQFSSEVPHYIFTKSDLNISRMHDLCIVMGESVSENVWFTN